MQTKIPCTLMRGGTSKGAYFLASDLPADVASRDRLLLAVMGSPDPRQIDGVGGADPLTSKVAIVSKSTRPGIDVDYLFCQVWVDRAEVSTQQNCGNILAGVAPFAIEQGLVLAAGAETRVRIFMVNSSQTVVATVQTPGGRPRYDGDAAIDGVPGTAAPIPLSFADTAGSTCGALLPTGRALDSCTACVSRASTTACRSSSCAPATWAAPATSLVTRSTATSSSRHASRPSASSPDR
jgi:4-oxalomesaconate tautomerase